MIKIAAVDDNIDHLFVVEMQIRSYNSTATGEKMELDVYQKPVDFIKEMKLSTVCQYDIVLIDMKMPLMNGFDVHTELSHICPNLRCFMVTDDIFNPKTFEEYDSIVSKNKFSIRDIIKRAFDLTRSMNHLEINIYQKDLPDRMLA